MAGGLRLSRIETIGDFLIARGASPRPPETADELSGWTTVVPFFLPVAPPGILSHRYRARKMGFRSFRKRYANLEAQRGPATARILEFPQFPQAICQWPVAWRGRRGTENCASTVRGDREFFRTV